MLFKDLMQDRLLHVIASAKNPDRHGHSTPRHAKRRLRYPGGTRIDPDVPILEGRLPFYTLRIATRITLSE